MIKKALLTCILLSTTIANAATVEPFGIKIGEPSEFYPINFEPNVNEPVKVDPPEPINQFFDTYNIYFNNLKVVRKIEATGNITNSPYSCMDIAITLNEYFLTTYKNAKYIDQNNYAFAYNIKNTDSEHQAYIECDQNLIRYVIFDVNLESQVKPEIKL